MEFPKPWEDGYEHYQADYHDELSRRPWDNNIPPVPQEILTAAKNNRPAQNNDISPAKVIKAEVFAREYVVDYNVVNALTRAGLIDEDTDLGKACNMGVRYMRNPVVLQAVKAFTSRIETEKIVSRERILAGLLEEACYNGPGCSSSARVAAWGKLAKLMGMEDGLGGPAGVQDAAKGGVMLVPFMGGIDEWEKVARGQQAQLKADVRA